MTIRADSLNMRRQRTAGAPLLEQAALIWCVALIVLSICWPRYGFLAFGSLKVTPYTVMALTSWPVLAILSILQTSLPARIFRGLLATPILTCLICSWFLWRMTSAMWGEVPGASFTIIFRDLFYVLPVWLFAVAIATRPGGLRIIVLTIVFVTLAIEAIAVIQLMTGRGLASLLGVNFVSTTGYNLGTAELAFRGGSARIPSVFTHPIVFGQFLAFVAPILAFVIWRARGLTALIATIALILVPIVAWNTGSRAALLAPVVALAIYIVLCSLRAAQRMTLPSILGLFLVFTTGAMVAIPSMDVASGLVTGRSAIEASSTRFRMAMYQKGLSAVALRPVAGYGDGRSPYHAGFHGRGGVLTIDSAYLSSLVDNGWVGLSIQLAAWGAIFGSLAGSALKLTARPEACAFAAGAAGLMIVFGILSITDNVTLLFIAAAVASGIRFQVLSAASRLRR